LAYDNEKRGVLFRNEKKSEKHPDYSGSATIEGVEYFMDAWLKESESGRKFMSFSFKAKQKREGTGKPVRGGRVVDDDAPPF
jgi:uncharacterized protein (DUF736 family)